MGEEYLSDSVDDIGSTGDSDVGDLLSDDSGSDQGTTDAGSTDLAKMVENLAKEVKGLQSLEGRRANDIGHLKKMIEGQMSGGQQSMDSGNSDFLSEFMNDPDGALARKLEEVETKKTQQKKSVQSQTVDAIKSVAPDFDKFQDLVISTVAKDVGASKQEVADSLFDGGPGIAINVYHRVKAEQKVKELSSLVEALKKKGVDIEGARAFSRGSTSGDSMRAPEDPLAGVDIRKMPKDQVQKLYQQHIASKRRS